MNGSWHLTRFCCLALAAVLGTGVAQAQFGLNKIPLPPPVAGDKLGQNLPESSKPDPKDKTIVDPNVKKAGCAGCGTGGILGPLFHHADAGGGGGGSCANGRCTPGRRQCTWCNYDTTLGRVIGGFYDCICCPDPCYEGCWVPEANAAFFQDYARPVTLTRIRWDHGLQFRRPDAAEFFWAKNGNLGGKGPPNPETGVDYDELTLYTEFAATPNASFFFEMPYRESDPDNNPHRAGFGDLNLGAKTLLLDCELLQFSFQFKTYILTGSPGKGLGTGHVSLEPSILASIKLTSSTYLQMQVAEWIPIGGDDAYAGATIHYHASLNQTLWRPHEDIRLIGTGEFNGFTFQDGAFTQPGGMGTTVGVSGESIFNAGGGLRLSFCKKLEIGAGAVFGFSDNGPEQLYRTEFRWKF